MSNAKNLTNFTSIDKPATPLAATMTGVRLPQHIHDKVANGFASGEEKSAWLREVIEASAIARWPELVAAVEVETVSAPAPLKFSLTISNMPARGKRGWVKKGEVFLRANQQDSHGASAQKLTFELEDGIYEVQDANFGSSRTNHYWLKVSNGEGVETEEPKPDLGVELPELEGSEKQIAWAEKIRAKAIGDCLINFPKSFQSLAKVCFVDTEEKAGWWIENSKLGKLDSKLLSWLKAQISQKTSEDYPRRDWEEYEEEYAHEGYGGDWVWKLEKFGQVFEGKGNGLSDEPIFCKNPESQEWEIWHYQPNYFGRY
jgi:hypothetical protein